MQECRISDVFILGLSHSLESTLLGCNKGEKDSKEAFTPFNLVTTVVTCHFHFHITSIGKTESDDSTGAEGAGMWFCLGSRFPATSLFCAGGEHSVGG